MTIHIHTFSNANSIIKHDETILRHCKILVKTNEDYRALHVSEQRDADSDYPNYKDMKTRLKQVKLKHQERMERRLNHTFKRRVLRAING